MPRRTATLLTSTLLLIGLLCAGMLIRVPYAEMSPGPTVDTMGEHDGEPVIDIPDQPTYDSEGHLNMTTVRVTGVDYRMNLVEAVYGWLADDRNVVPHETLYPQDVSADEVEQQNAEEFSASQESAKVAALEELGWDVASQTVVGAVVEDSPAEGRLHAGDAIVAVDGTKVDRPQQVAELVTEHEPGEDVVFTIDDTRDVTLTTAAAPDDNRAIVGIQATVSHTFPFEIDIELADVGGPSAGLMFALGIIDRLTEEDLTGGAFIAGTGTIDDEGTVGPIGGVAMKTIAAREAGAEFFLTPEDNCAAAAADAPDGLTLVRVGTLEDALAALADIRADRTGDLPLCPAG
jgi:PDZ domain-containing protein